MKSEEHAKDKRVKHNQVKLGPSFFKKKSFINKNSQKSLSSQGNDFESNFENNRNERQTKDRLKKNRNNRLDSIQEKKLEYDIQEEEVDLRVRIYILFLLMNVFLNYDTGVIPGALVQISDELSFNSEQMAYLGSFVYLGLCAATFLGHYVFHTYQAKWVISIMVFLNAICCFIFAYSTNMLMLYSCRFLIGFTQAFVVIYAPVWINEFSPSEANTRWMAGLHSGVVVGILSGYIFAQVVINYFSHYATWRLAIYFQGGCQALLSLIAMFVDNKNLDVRQKLTEENISMISGKFIGENRHINDKRIDTVDSDNIGHICHQFKILCSNYVFIFVTLCLCSVYFVVTGIQFWTTAYFLLILNENPEATMINFSVVCITAPVAGVIVGSHFSDYIGGYKGENLLKSIKLCALFGFFAFLFAFPIGFMDTLWTLIPLLWLLLFTGAMLTPTCTGIIVSSVPRKYQTASSSMSQLINNLGGYFLAPVLSAYVMDCFDDEKEGFIWGYRVVLWWSIFGLVFIACAWIYVSNSERGSDDDDDKDPSEIKRVELEILRRQAQSYSI
ncbi:unnamed protein product [Moneuplotes crassus]|uniref:Major facilitator superfamily (MFS) profile domain-containing protein n=1 Tax=Euplotes crassus TaxID=5936 RepID=A0AAD1X8H1_EUPCR|nr:unnamed protein product [Moneuplotes crassus]